MGVEIESKGPEIEYVWSCPARGMGVEMLRNKCGVDVVSMSCPARGMGVEIDYFL